MKIVNLFCTDLKPEFNMYYLSNMNGPAVLCFSAFLFLFGWKV